MQSRKRMRLRELPRLIVKQNLKVVLVMRNILYWSLYYIGLNVVLKHGVNLLLVYFSHFCWINLLWTILLLVYNCFQGSLLILAPFIVFPISNLCETHYLFWNTWIWRKCLLIEIELDDVVNISRLSTKPMKTRLDVCLLLLCFFVHRMCFPLFIKLLINLIILLLGKNCSVRLGNGVWLTSKKIWDNSCEMRKTCRGD